MRKKTIQTKDISDQEIIDACNAFREANQSWRIGKPIPATPDVSLAHKYPVKVIMAKMDQMERRGILESGVSLRTAWVKKKAGSR